MPRVSRKNKVDVALSMSTVPYTEAPTFGYLSALRTELETIYGDQDGQIDRTRQVRDLKRVVALPEPYRLVDVEVRDPTVTDEIARVTATLSVNPPKLTCTPIRQSDSAAKNAADRSAFTQELLRVCGQRSPGMPTFNAVVDSVVGDGAAWTKFLFTRDMWANRYSVKLDDFDDDATYPEDAKGKSKAQKFNDATEDVKKLDGPPFTWKLVDVRTIYPLFTGGKLSEVLEVQNRPEISTFRQYRLTRNKKGDICYPEELGESVSKQEIRNYSQVEMYEHWDDTYVSYCVMSHNKNGDPTGKIVQQWEHGLGRPPYFVAYGHFRNYWQNHKVGWGVSESKRWLVEYRSFLWTLLSNICARDAMPPIAREIPPDNNITGGDTGEPKAIERWDPREIINLRPGEKLIPMSFPPVADAVMKTIEQVTKAIAELEAPRVTSEIGGGMEGAGFAINQVLAEARLRHDPLCQSIERMLCEITEFAWQLIREKVQETVWVSSSGATGTYLSASPNDLTPTVDINWKLDPEMPSAKLIEGRYHAEQVKNGFESKDQAIIAQGGNPSEVREQQAMDRMRGTPWYQQFQDSKVMQQLGKGDILGDAAKAAHITATGQMPAGGPAMQGGAGGAPPDMGALAMAPNQVGAAPVGPIGPPPGPQGPPNGSVRGAAMGAVIPNASATPGAQMITGP